MTNAEFAVGEAEAVIPKWYEKGVKRMYSSWIHRVKAATKNYSKPFFA